MRETDIHSADLAYRRRSLLIIAAIVLLALFALWQLDGWLTGLASQLAQDGDPQRTRRWLRGLLVALGAVAVAGAQPAASGRGRAGGAALPAAQLAHPARRARAARGGRAALDRTGAAHGRGRRRAGGLLHRRGAGGVLVLQAALRRRGEGTHAARRPYSRSATPSSLSAFCINWRAESLSTSWSRAKRIVASIRPRWVPQSKRVPWKR